MLAAYRRAMDGAGVDGTCAGRPNAKEDEKAGLGLPVQRIRRLRRVIRCGFCRFGSARPPCQTTRPCAAPSGVRCRAKRVHGATQRADHWQQQRRTTRRFEATGIATLARRRRRSRILLGSSTTGVACARRCRGSQRSSRRAWRRGGTRTPLRGGAWFASFETSGKPSI